MRRESEECVSYLHQSCDALLEGNNIIGDAGSIGHDYAGGEALQVVREIGGGAIAAVAGAITAVLLITSAA